MSLLPGSMLMWQLYISFHICLTVSSVCSLCCFHVITFYIFCHILKMVPLCHCNRPKCLSVSIFYCLHLGAKKCQTRIKEMEKLVKPAGSQIKPTKTFGVLLGKDATFLEVAFQKGIQGSTKQTRDWTTSKMRRCGLQSHPLTTVSHTRQQHAGTPSFLSTTPVNNKATQPEIINRKKEA